MAAFSELVASTLIDPMQTSICQAGLAEFRPHNNALSRTHVACGRVVLRDSSGPTLAVKSGSAQTFDFSHRWPATIRPLQRTVRMNEHGR